MQDLAMLFKHIILQIVTILITTQATAIYAQTTAPTSMLEWTNRTFAGETPKSTAPDTQPSITVRRQDYGQLERGRSVMKQPLLIGSVTFQHGLGTHANSDLLVTLPNGTKTFEAKIGVDSDHNAGGTVVFSVEAGGKELFRSDVLRGGAQPVSVHVDLPENTRTLTLKADTTPDGPSADHADWADAKVVTADGSLVWFDELPIRAAQAPTEFLPANELPFSFVYGGRSSRELLAGWERKALEPNHTPAGATQRIQWSDTKTGLKLVADLTPLPDFPAVEWVLHFHNTGTADTPILENVQVLDQILGTGPADSPLTLDRINGSTAGENDFVPQQHELKPGDTVRLAPHGGRSSDGTFPFFNLRTADGGVFVALGWTGQWSASLNRFENGTSRVQAGMELTHLKLHPGESIRTPRILLLRWKGDVDDAHNLFRRMMLAHYQPKLEGAPVKLAIGAQSFNSWYLGKRSEWATEAGQLASAKINQSIGADTLWMDAGWFPGGFPNGVGNWVPRPNDFPHGLKPVGEECKKLGLRFLVWFEPERVAPGTQLASEHPEFILGGKAGGLFNLGDEKARRYMTDLLDHYITDWGLSCYREDFNMEPLPYWRQNDPADRQGITEIRHVEGLYAMWDELRAKHPGLYIDNCASGGRRIDLETCRRAVVQTRSDSEGGPGRADWEQSQTWGLSQYVPLNASFTWDLTTYDFRSYATGGFLGEWDILDPKFPADSVRAGFAEIRANQKYWTGDYYPLTPWTMAADKWMAYQFHLPDLNAGMVLAFRHAQSPEASLRVTLHGINPQAAYEVEFVDEDRKSVSRVLSGRELASLKLQVPRQRASILVRYRMTPK